MCTSTCTWGPRSRCWGCSYNINITNIKATVGFRLWHWVIVYSYFRIPTQQTRRFDCEQVVRNCWIMFQYICANCLQQKRAHNSTFCSCHCRLPWRVRTARVTSSLASDWIIWRPGGMCTHLTIWQWLIYQGCWKLLLLLYAYKYDCSRRQNQTV